MLRTFNNQHLRTVRTHLLTLIGDEGEDGEADEDEAKEKPKPRDPEVDGVMP